MIFCIFCFLISSCTNRELNSNYVKIGSDFPESKYVIDNLNFFHNSASTACVTVANSMIEYDLKTKRICSLIIFPISYEDVKTYRDRIVLKDTDNDSNIDLIFQLDKDLSGNAIKIVDISLSSTTRSATAKKFTKYLDLIDIRRSSEWSYGEIVNGYKFVERP